MYEADCVNDGYMIGVCEYCSEILEEKHIDASGHDYKITVDISATETVSGVKYYSCANCGDTRCEYIPPSDGDYERQSYNVSGRVVIASDKKALSGKSPARNCNIVIDGITMAVTDSSGNFEFALETGSYAVQIEYAFGFTRTIFIVVADGDISCGDIPIIGCDFNKDGRIDDTDLQLLNMVMSSKADDPSYLYYADINSDGYINAKDMLYVKKSMGIDSAKYQYPEIVVKK